jgi:phosphoribosylglycinamide formyltransferase-1
MKRINLAVFASGRGSNLETIIKKIKSGELTANVGLVISNKSDAGALSIAKDNNIPAIFISREQFSLQEEFDEKLLSILKEYRIELIVLAGYLKKIGSRIISEYKNGIINIHPALLPAFGGKGMYGMKVHQAVIEYGVKVTGISVHIVDEDYDHGPIVLQEVVNVMDDDTPETLAHRVLEIEHETFYKAIQLFAEGRVKVNGRKVIINS